jgi:hypothetical protein
MESASRETLRRFSKRLALHRLLPIATNPALERIARRADRESTKEANKATALKEAEVDTLLYSAVCPSKNDLAIGVPLSETWGDWPSPMLFSPRGCIIDDTPQRATPKNLPSGEWLHYLHVQRPDSFLVAGLNPRSTRK